MKSKNKNNRLTHKNVSAFQILEVGIYEYGLCSRQTESWNCYGIFIAVIEGNQNKTRLTQIKVLPADTNHNRTKCPASGKTCV